MLYKVDGSDKLYSQKEIDDAVRLANEFQVGNLKPILNVNAEIAKAIMSGNHSKAVTMFAKAEGINRSEAREHLVHCGEDICRAYMSRTN